MHAGQNKAQNLGDLVELAVEESLRGQLVVHLRAELLDALCVSVRQVGGVLALEKTNNLLQIHRNSNYKYNYKQPLHF